MTIRSRIASWFARSSFDAKKWFVPKFGNQVGETFSVAESRMLTAVAAAIGCISWRIATMPLRVYDVRSRLGEVEAAPDDPEVLLVTKRWSHHMSAVDGLQHFVGSVLLHGVGGALVRRGPMNEIAAIQALDPRGISRKRTGSEIVYTIQDGAEQKPVLRDELLFLAFATPDDGVSDKSPLDHHWPAIRAALAATNFSGWYFDRGAIPSTAWVRTEDGGDPGDLAKESAAFWRHEDTMRREGRRSFLAPTGWSPKAIGGNPQETQLTAQRAYGVQEVARIYDIPPLLLQDLSNSTYSNFRQARFALGELLEQWAIRVAAEFSNVLWPGGARVCRFDTSMAIREPFQQRAQGYKTMREAGVLTQNECRELEGMPQSDEEGADLLKPTLAPQMIMQGGGDE